MRSAGRKIAVAFLCCVICSANAFDLYYDAGEQDGPEIRDLSADPGLVKQTTRFFRFAKAFSPRLLRGKATEKDLTHFFNLLELDPDSMEIISILFLISRNETSLREKVFDRFIRMAREKPSAFYLSVIAGERFFSKGDLNLAEPFLLHALPHFTAHGTMEKILKNKQNLPRQALFSLFCKHYVILLRRREWDSLQNADLFLSSHPALANHPEFQQEMILHLMECFEKAEDDTAALPFPILSNREAARERLLRRIPPYLALFRDPEKAAKPAAHTRAFEAIERFGKKQELLNPLLNSLIWNPADTISLQMLAKLYASLGRNADAARTWRLFLDLEEAPPLICHLEYLFQLKSAGFMKKAIDTAKAIRPLSPPSVQSNLDIEIITAYIDLNDLEQALENTNRLPPSFVKYHLSLLIQYRRKQFKKAYTAAMHAVELVRKHDPNAVDSAKQSGKSFWFLCAMAAEKCGDIAAVESLLSPLLNAQPNDPEILNFIGYTLANHNRKLEQAQIMIEKALKANPASPEILDSMAWVLYRRKQFKKALAFISKSISLAQKNKTGGVDALLFDHAGDIYLAIGNHSKAKTCWEKALRLESEDTDYDQIHRKLRSLTDNAPPPAATEKK